ncbi:hypothetical protein G210_1624 [Candida maltosa Xu316]|uniref:Uncharacterized protein n=1 Tax=Candida maltosa (strain Xu316) TaxID=1245528 RepID=M3J752_CANMX|nr:hypothetical protein G210_1624 [Candida maltosa Xu316]
MLPVLDTIYTNLLTPSKITIPKYVQAQDLMDFKHLLSTIRKVTNSHNKNLINLENELIEQSAEMGHLDAITLLAFETIKNRTNVPMDDFKHANKLIRELTDLKHPLVFKMAGDLAWENKAYTKALEYWQSFLVLEPNSELSVHVYFNMGYYYFTFLTLPDLELAKFYFEKCIGVSGGDLNDSTVKSHYYLGQMYVDVNPKVLEVGE